MFRRLIKIFLASPGDLVGERLAARRIVNEENKNHANHLGYQLELVGWEDTVSQFRRAQAAINIDLDQCEYFVGMMWKKWGTAPGPEGHPYTSGFEEEFKRSVERRKASGKPDISLLFKNVSAELLADAGPELTKVLEFQRSIRDDKEAYYQTFDTDRDFDEKFRAVVSKFLRDQVSRDTADGGQSSRPHLSDATAGEPEQRDVDEQAGMSSEASLRSLLPSFSAAGDVSPTSIARLRLLATAYDTSANDDLNLGPHDANLIFRNAKEAEFSNSEVFGLIRSGIIHLANENVPLWHWLSRSPAGVAQELGFRTFYESETLRENAFRALRMLHPSISLADGDSPIDRMAVIEESLSERAPDDVRIACLQYLSATGTSSDFQHIDPLVGSSEANLSAAAVKAKCKILAGTSVADALTFLSAWENVDVGPELALELAKNLPSVATDILVSAIGNRSTPLRRSIAIELGKRGGLTKELATTLCESDDVDTRLLGARVLFAKADELSLEAAKAAIVKPRLGLLSALSGVPEKDKEGERHFARFKREIVGLRTLPELEAAIQQSTLFDRHYLLAAYDSHFSKMGDDLRENLSDRFRGFVNQKRKQVEGSPLWPDDDLADYISRTFVQSALEILCRRGSAADLPLVRDILADKHIVLETSIAEFLGKYGDWEDAEKIAKFAKEYWSKFNWFLYAAQYAIDPDETAAALLKLGAKRPSDLLGLDLPENVKRQIIKMMAKSAFATAVSDGQILKLLLHSSDSLRRTVALKAVASLGKVRLNKILKAYLTTQETQYYNAIFWLDLGVSMPGPAARATAARLLAEQT